jgi:fibronectin type 3 domain-containing protein
MDGVNNNGYPFLQWQNFPPIIPGIPQNVIVSESSGTIQLHWDVVTGANSYKVYSSNNPYGTFAEDISGIFTDESWTAPINTAMKYYCVKAVN